MANKIKNSGNILWNKAKTIIPGGNMLLSKKSEMFLPNYWPSYFSKAKGCEVWDLDNNKYFDMSIMGIGTNILGYGNSDIDNAVAAAKEAFNDFLDDKRYSKNQIEFVNLIIDYLTEHGAVEQGRVYESPFTTVAPEGPEKLFDADELDRIFEVIESITVSATGTR